MIRRPPRSTLFPLHDALPISSPTCLVRASIRMLTDTPSATTLFGENVIPRGLARSEEHTSELQSQSNLVCRLLLEKKNPPSLTPAASPRRERHPPPLGARHRR